MISVSITVSIKAVEKIASLDLQISCLAYTMKIND